MKCFIQPIRLEQNLVCRARANQTSAGYNTNVVCLSNVVVPDVSMHIDTIAGCRRNQVHCLPFNIPCLPSTKTSADCGQEPPIFLCSIDCTCCSGIQLL